MTWLSRAAIVYIAACSLAVAACDGDHAPVAPTPTSTPTGPLVVSVTGRVLDGSGNAVGGARITAPGNSGGPIEVVADAAGAYTFSIDARSVRVPLVVEKDGFEPSQLAVWLGVNGATGDVTQDLRLHQIVRASAGASVELSIRPNDPLCGVDEVEWLCRRVRVVSPVAGQLLVVPAILATDIVAGQSIRLRLAGRPDVFPPSALNVAVGAGSETILEILLVGGGDLQPLTLHTNVSR